MLADLCCWMGQPADDSNGDDTTLRPCCRRTRSEASPEPTDETPPLKRRRRGPSPVPQLDHEFSSEADSPEAPSARDFMPPTEEEGEGENPTPTTDVPPHTPAPDVVQEDAELGADVDVQHVNQETAQIQADVDVQQLEMAIPQLPQYICFTANPEVASEAATQPAKPGWDFFKFPAEIRNMIYDYSLHWPTSEQLYAPYNRQRDRWYRNTAAAKYPQYNGVLRAPTILLLCKKITAECLPILQARTLVINTLPPWLPYARRSMLVSQFIGRRTLQSVRHLEISVPLGQGCLGSGWAWFPVVCDLFGILRERNSFKSLKMVLLAQTDIFTSNTWVEELQYLEIIQAKFDNLRLNNPRWWDPGTMEMHLWKIKGSKAVRWYPDENFPADSEVEIRTYPDKEIWPGSIFEFL